MIWKAQRRLFAPGSKISENLKAVIPQKDQSGKAYKSWPPLNHSRASTVSTCNTIKAMVARLIAGFC